MKIKLWEEQLLNIIQQDCFKLSSTRLWLSKVERLRSSLIFDLFTWFWLTINYLFEDSKSNSSYLILNLLTLSIGR